ncbi:MAG: endolytic transglycosylase MltG, partial [Muribaculaceae bacterium]|nr:endolytic transglycosylase MltG [Muribaculaceae bacterium]
LSRRQRQLCIRARSVTRRLTHGAQTPVKITINGFRSLDNLTSRISAKLDFPADSLRKILADPEVMSPYGLTPDQALALFVDDTYELYWTASPEDVVKKIGANYLSLWNDKRRNRATILGLSPAQVMTICSIVDEETNAESEKGTIGRLYINRLNRGMKLQADPTVRFALDDFSIRRVKGEHLKADSPYNTYRYPGLPPGPIRTTGKTTIDLVLDSPANDYIFMCAKEDFSGTHNFASNYAEHQENARKYQKALDARGIN